MRLGWFIPTFLAAVAARAAETPAKSGPPAFEKLAREFEYDAAGHALNSEARQDRIHWLAERLKLAPIDNAAIAQIPELGKKAKAKD